MQVHGLGVERGVFLLAQVLVAHHVLKHGVAALQALVGVQDGVVHRGALQHAYKGGGLIGGHLFRRGAEVGAAGGLDAERVGTEVYRVGIHRQNLLLRVNYLQLGGYHPFLALLHYNADAGYLAQQPGGVLGAHAEHVLGQLLRYRRGSAGLAVYNGVFQGACQTIGVYAVVAEETLVLGVNKGGPEHGIHILVFHRTAVLVVEFAYPYTIGTVYLGGNA